MLNTTLATLSASTIEGTDVFNADGEQVGTIKDIMIDFQAARVAYAVLSFGGFLGFNDKLFAVPMEAMTLDKANERVIFNIDKERLENAPGFDQDDWPSTANYDWFNTIYTYYNVSPYWTAQPA